MITIDTTIPTYLKMLHVFEKLHNDFEKHAVLQILTTQELQILEREIVTYKIYLKKQVARLLSEVIMTYSISQLRDLDSSLCIIAKLAVSNLFPAKHDIQQYVGESIDYSAFELCLDIKNDSFNLNSARV
jgi:hypothetical protein